jgi:hypothetical protein
MRRYLFAVLIFLLCYNVLSYTTNLLWTFLYRLIIPPRTVLAAAEVTRWCRRRVRADNVFTSSSISSSQGASRPIDQRPDIRRSRLKSSSSTRR